MEEDAIEKNCLIMHRRRRRVKRRIGEEEEDDEDEVKFPSRYVCVFFRFGFDPNS